MKKLKKLDTNEFMPDHSEFSYKIQEDKAEYSVFIGNLNSANINNNEFNKIINQFLKSNSKTNNSIIKSIKIYTDSIYINFNSKQDAISAANFFNNYSFKNLKFVSFFINSFKSDGEIGNDQIEKETLDYDYKNQLWTDSIECEILVSNRVLKKYSDIINERLQKSFFGLNTYIKYSNNDINQELHLNKQLIRDAFQRNLLYLITISHSNEKYNSLNLIILNKWRFLKLPKNTYVIKEYKNIPSNKAFDIIRTDYRDYLNNIKDIYLNSETQLFKKKSVLDKEEYRAKNNDTADKKLFEIVTNKFKNYPKIELEDIDFLISYLKNQKSKLISNFGISDFEKNKNQNVFQKNQSKLSQFIQPSTQNIPSLMQPESIPSLLSHPVFYSNPQNQPLLSLPSAGDNTNNSKNQIPALMSLQNQVKNVNQVRVPALMTLKPNFKSGQNNNFQNNKRN